MVNLLAQHFPMIRTRTQILADIQTTPNLASVYNQWPAAIQEEFLDVDSNWTFFKNISSFLLTSLGKAFKIKVYPFGHARS